MSSPKPLHSFLGGLGLSLPVHTLLLLNGTVFGISGFLHRAVRGHKEAAASAMGLLSGGVCIGLLGGSSPQPFSLSPFPLLISGLLVGIGSKMANGCTSGHMIAGISRFSPRSIAATATFFTTGVITARIFHRNFVPTQSFDWSLGSTGKALLALQAVPLFISMFLYAFPRSLPRYPANQDPPPPHPLLRLIASLSTSFEFALALRLSNLTEPIRVVAFLLLPGHKAFDPSLAFLAFGALPVAILLHQFARGSEQPRLGGKWSVPKGGQVDAKLLAGAALFGIGWGLSGICPGPGIVNLGQALVTRSDPLPMIGWLVAAAVGGSML
ncbi:hypothetical protein C8J57DRAFT_654684 [Mycena rebaudengoi]|nr:hypothetical protein C8J57DRAFT_654684 [Mycena rebaudengoi]